MLSPVHYRRRPPRPVSYYALLKWWLLLSQHPGCPGGPTSFRTEHGSGTLAGGLGCSPLDDEAYPPPSSCRTLVRRDLGVWSAREAGGAPFGSSSPTPPAPQAQAQPQNIF